jgi:hypothetical protein
LRLTLHYRFDDSVLERSEMSDVHAISLACRQALVKRCFGKLLSFILTSRLVESDALGDGVGRGF